MAEILPATTPGISETIDAYRARGGYRGLERALSLSTTAVIDEVAASGLRGRGGAAFPTAAKWKSAAEAKADAKYVVVNGAEGEPGSFKDRALMAASPHSVIEGMLIGAYAIGAREILFYVNDVFTDAIAALRAALDEAVAARYFDRVGATYRLIPETHVYIAGEETALINVLMGNPAQPWHKPPYPTTSGYQKMPTVVNNVETLADVAAIFRNGPAWYREHQPALFSVDGDVVHPGVYEFPLGTRLAEVLQAAGGPMPGETIQAVLPGGYSMPWLGPDQLQVRLDYQTLKDVGTGLGASLIVIGSNRDLRQVAWQILDFFRAESCGKCPVCVKGTANMAQSMGQQLAADRTAEPDAEALMTLALKHRHKGICSFLDTAAHMAETALPAFRDPSRFQHR